MLNVKQAVMQNSATQNSCQKFLSHFSVI